MPILVSYLLARLAEPSTWAGFAAVLAGVHVSVSQPVWSQATNAGMAAAALAAALLKEKPLN